MVGRSYSNTVLVDVDHVFTALLQSIAVTRTYLVVYLSFQMHLLSRVPLVILLNQDSSRVVIVVH